MFIIAMANLLRIYSFYTLLWYIAILLALFKVSQDYTIGE